ncbi:hypothetical protein SAMN04490244_101290 [Tranquillimonas rosea]|uniref:Uncharacterized protein n=1 Tax=Tranquillimonas rosea TaxID=641238 RepID=A0A1H9PSD1_9RHOB|nr:hypothetical protein [Tranquillimonas rosea]SER50483.1 hypothetical protein SAMN04490244_101290 [Tranquillimonas rosea]
MPRNNSPDSIQDAIYRAYDAAGGLREVSRIIGLSVSTLSVYTDPARAHEPGLGSNHLDRLCAARPLAAAEMAAHYAELGGGVFQPVDVQTNVTSLYEQAGATAKEFGEAQAAMLRAAEHNSKGNRDAADREIDDAVQYLLSYKALMRKQRGAA